MFYLLPPSGTPISPADVFRIGAVRIASAKSGDRFADEMAQFTGARRVWLVNSGRTAQFILLKACSDVRGSDKSEVLVPAYTCFSVPASIARADLKIRLVDIDPMTMDYNAEKLRSTDFSRVLAIIGCNLFGIVSNWRTLRDTVAGEKIYLIDDAAQSLGTCIDGRQSGMSGDAGFFSLDRGKNLSTWSGGILFTNNDELARRIDTLVMPLPTFGAFAEFSVWTKMLVYSLLLRPRCYWLPNLLPFLGLGETIYDADFSASKLSRLQKTAGEFLLPRLAALNEARRATGQTLAEAISAIEGLAVPGFSTDHCPIYLRLPVLAPDRNARDRLVKRVRQSGIMASTMYPSTIRDIPGIESRLASDDNDFPGARQIVDRLFTLPTHPYVRERDINRIIACLKEHGQ